MPSIFSRFADIVNSNLNAMLDKAENPAKMVRLVIAEMEDTLVEIKAACAQAMADQAQSVRRLREVQERTELWQGRAEAAARKGRDDLAREALLEKRSATVLAGELKHREMEMAAVVEKYRSEIDQLEAKLTQARERELVLVHREKRAATSLKASGQMKRYDLSESRLKLDRLDDRLNKLEAVAELELTGRRLSAEAAQRERAFQELDDALDLELQEIKDRLAGR
jgi:phage shock protein A